ncbi:MAG: hypothetical protein PQJ59_07550 [Spirochaetales bacterium]|nr:hypothetical protein [Spirochaetales bacterium]
MSRHSIIVPFPVHTEEDIEKKQKTLRFCLSALEFLCFLLAISFLRFL